MALDTSLLTPPYTRVFSTAAVSSFSPLNDIRGVPVNTAVSFGVIGIPNVLDSEILISIGGVSALVYDNTGFQVGWTGTTNVVGGVSSFNFSRDTAFPYNTEIIVGMYDVGVEIGITTFWTEIDPEYVSGWRDQTAIEPYLLLPFTKFPNMELYRQTLIAAAATNSPANYINAKRLVELLHVTELGDYLASLYGVVTPTVTGQFKTTSNSAASIASVVTLHDRRFKLGLQELSLFGLAAGFTRFIKSHYDGTSTPHRLSAVSMALQLAAILENDL